jgi:hypothetical protein
MSTTLKTVMLSSVLSIGLTFPAATLIGLIWRFPVPMGDYAEGIEALVMAPMAVFFYLFLGGFIVVPLVSTVVTLVALRFKAQDAASDPVHKAVPWPLLFATSGGTAVAFVLLLAGLELVIGPW